MSLFGKLTGGLAAEQDRIDARIEAGALAQAQAFAQQSRKDSDIAVERAEMARLTELATRARTRRR